MCSVPIEPNAANTCLDCLRSRVDITDGISKQITMHQCRNCERYQRPPWMACDWESRELLALCLKKVNGLGKVKLVDAAFVWTESHSKRIKLKLTVQNGLLAVILLGSIPLKKYPFKALLGSAIKVNDAAWRTLTLRYGLYFLAVAILNEIFRSPAAVTALWHALGRDTPNPNDVWTSFRGVLWIAASIFGLSQVPLIMKNMTKDEEPGPISPDTGM